MPQLRHVETSALVVEGTEEELALARSYLPEPAIVIFDGMRPGFDADLFVENHAAQLAQQDNDAEPTPVIKDMIQQAKDLEDRACTLAQRVQDAF